MTVVSRSAKWLLALTAAAAIACLFLLSTGSPGTPASPAIRDINVSGFVPKSGADILYMEVSFTSVKSNATYVAQVFNNMYKISLPSSDTYEVKLLVHFAGYIEPWTYSEGTLDLNINETSYRMDLQP
jgi:hypothetical protein